MSLPWGDAPEIDRVMTVSTAHITPQTAAVLEKAPKDDQFPLMSFADEYGYMLWVPDADCVVSDTPDAGYASLPADLWQLLRRAAVARCRWLRLDCDAVAVKGWETYAW